MKIFNKKLFNFALAIAIFLGGCSGNTMKINNGRYNGDEKIDPSNVDFSRGRDVTSTASGFQLLLFIPININDRHERAYQILKAQVGDDYIGEVKIKESWTYALVGTVYTTRLEAKVYSRNR